MFGSSSKNMPVLSRRLAISLAMSLLTVTSAVGCLGTNSTPETYSAVEASPGNIDFGTVPKGTEQTESLKLVVTSADAVVLDSVSVEVDTAAQVEGGGIDYQVILPDGVELPFELAANAELVVLVRYTPLVEGDRSGRAIFRFQQGGQYKVLGGGCADNPTGDETTDLAPADVIVPLNGFASGPAPCRDEDNDGFMVDDGDCIGDEPPEPDWCDDAPLRHPGVTDVCDGVDNDCDGSVDEDFTSGPTTCTFGTCEFEGTTACENGAVVDNCEHPPFPPIDTTCDGVDDDCDGDTDEDFEASETTCGEGVCAATGASTCVDGVVGDSCVPGDPSDEVCDGADNDCDGATDEDIAAVPSTCGVGACAATGEVTCVDGVDTDSCVVGDPADEICDGVDNDCDGATDEDLAALPSTCGEGACAAVGEIVCQDGAPVDTCLPGAGGEEICDGVDNDCDGATDEDIPSVPTECGAGDCTATGEIICQDGAPVDTCEPGDGGDEICDGVDNDCDGLTDEDIAAVPTECGEGACAATGELICQDGAPVDTCVPPNVADDDATCDGVDDDCDGETDEDFVSGAISCGVGACEATGTRDCVDGETVEDCTPGDPIAENDVTCDNVDDDCDGETDEDALPEAITCGTGACEADGTRSCVDGETVDDCTPGDPLSDTDPTCDNIDDDCDGLTDDDYEGAPVTCGTGACERTAGRQCIDGDVVDDECVPGDPLGPDDATCDGVDDDCDGATDEEFEATLIACGEGVCESEGLRDCVDGGVVDNCTPGQPAPRDTACNTLDDDCDGETDENLPIIGGVDGCEQDVPVIWGGETLPAPSTSCFGFTLVNEQSAQVRLGGPNGDQPVDVGPALRIVDEGDGGTLFVRTLPIGVMYQVETQLATPTFDEPVAMQIRFRMEQYLGDPLSPGAAVYLSNGSHGVWVNIVQHGFYVLRGAGDVIAYQAADTQSIWHTLRLVLNGDSDVRVTVDGKASLALPGALLDAPADPVARVRFGDWSDAAGAITAWDDLALFTLPTEQLDADADGVDVCGGDCADDDALISPRQPENPCDAIDNDCDPTNDGVAPTLNGPDDVLPTFYDGSAPPVVGAGCGSFSVGPGPDGPTTTNEDGVFTVTSCTDPTKLGAWEAPWDGATGAGVTLVVRARVRVNCYTGPTDEPGNAISLWDGSNELHLNLTTDSVVLIGDGGVVLGSAPVDLTGGFHDVWLIVDDGDVYIAVDGKTLIYVEGGSSLGGATAETKASFGDSSTTAGADADWDEFGVFEVKTPDWLDRDGDGYVGRVDCDDTDPAIHPEQGELVGDAIDQNCDGDPDKKPFCRELRCTGPDPGPDVSAEGCYRVFEYPDGWDGDPTVINLGVSGGSIGDVNGDGFEDIGFNHNDEVYLRFGQPADRFGLHTVPAEGFTVRIGGVDEVDQLGHSGVTGADINGDGYDDIVIGAHFERLPTGEQGRVYVFFGRPDDEWEAFYNASEANIIINPNPSGEMWSAPSTTAIADINGDGLAEIGVKAADIMTRAKWHIFFGHSDWTWDTTAETFINDEADVTYTDPSAFYLGSSVGDAIQVTTIGDFDADGYNDLVLAAPGRDRAEGSVFLVFGRATADWPTEAQPLESATDVMRIDFCCSTDPVDPGSTSDGAHVAQGGDLNADGYSDLVYTARTKMFVIAGRERDTLPVLAQGEVYDPVDQGDFMFEDPETTFPFDVAYVGDVDGDGYDDVLVSTGEEGGPLRNLDNVSYLFYGRPALDWEPVSEVGGTYDACFYHGPSAAGAHVGRGGDFNVDGLDEMVFSAPLRKELRVLYGDWY